MHKDTILITGAFGQIGSELTVALQTIYGEDNVIVSDIRYPDHLEVNGLRYEELNILETKRLAQIIDTYKVTQIYHLAAVLSATGEQDPLFAWQINMEGTLNLLNVAREKKIRKVYFPSSIAVFGNDSPKANTPQNTIMNPSTVYGISKQAGERWCDYYFRKYQLDVRSLRYPGIISYKTLPGGGTTDYAIDIFHQAIQGNSYECFLQKDCYLPMMYMPDAIKATINLMEAEASQISVRSSYNVGAVTFSPEEIYREIKQHHPQFEISYRPDFRQQIADTWPSSIDDSQARIDWGWEPSYDLAKMTEDMLENLQKEHQEITA